MLYCTVSKNRRKFRRGTKASLKTAITTKYTNKSTIPYLSHLVIIIKLLKIKVITMITTKMSLTVKTRTTPFTKTLMIMMKKH